MTTLKDRLLASPRLIAAAGRMLWLVGQSDDPYAFIYYCKQGDIERAFDTINMPNEEIHEEIATIRHGAEEAARDISGFEDSTREEVYN